MGSGREQPVLVYVESDIPPEMTIADYRARRAQRAAPRPRRGGRARGPAARAVTLISSLLQRG